MLSKTRIAISSILKPVFDPRNYKKIGITLAESNIYEVFISGYPEESTETHPGIQVFPSKNFARISISRILQPIKTFKYWIKVKPQLIIVNTHELLIVSILYKIIFGAKIIYDIQENYFINISRSHAFPLLIRNAISYYVWLKEWLASYFMDGFILAERCYDQELKFIHKPYIIAQNKSIETISLPKTAKNEVLKFVYSGTISEEYGIFDAIDFSIKLKEHFPVSTFDIIGYCPNDKTLHKLKEKISSHPYINLIGGDKLIPHNQLIKNIREADFCLLPYFFPSYYSNRIPTRIYECLSQRTPMIIRKNPAWDELFDTYDAFVYSDFLKISPLLQELIQTRKFYTKGDLNKAIWDDEKGILLGFVKLIF